MQQNEKVTKDKDYLRERLGRSLRTIIDIHALRYYLLWQINLAAVEFCISCHHFQLLKGYHIFVVSRHSSGEYFNSCR